MAKVPQSPPQCSSTTPLEEGPTFPCKGLPTSELDLTVLLPRIYRGALEKKSDKQQRKQLVSTSQDGPEDPSYASPTCALSERNMLLKLHLRLYSEKSVGEDYPCLVRWLVAFARATASDCASKCGSSLADLRLGFDIAEGQDSPAS